jgi:hypothetical protein
MKFLRFLLFVIFLVVVLFFVQNTIFVSYPLPPAVGSNISEFSLEEAIDATEAFASKLMNEQLPISIIYRKSYLLKGYVVTLHNHSKEDLTIEVTAKSKNKESHSWNLIIPSYEKVSLSWYDDWTFKDNDTIIIRSIKYRTTLFNFVANNY